MSDSLVSDSQPAECLREGEQSVFKPELKSVAAKSPNYTG